MVISTQTCFVIACQVGRSTLLTHSLTHSLTDSPSQPQSIVALLSVPNYTCLLMRQMRVNDLPTVVTTSSHDRHNTHHTASPCGQGASFINIHEVCSAQSHQPRKIAPPTTTRKHARIRNAANTGSINSELQINTGEKLRSASIAARLTTLTAQRYQIAYWAVVGFMCRGN